MPACYHGEKAASCRYCRIVAEWPNRLTRLAPTLETLGVSELPDLVGSPRQVAWALDIRANKLEELSASWNGLVGGLSALVIGELRERAVLNADATHWISKRLEAYPAWVSLEKDALGNAITLENGISPDQPTVAPSSLKLAWAEFMSLCRWSFVCDPPAIGYWQPDFAITGDLENTIYVAVVPTRDFPKKIASQLEAVNEATGVPGEILLLGDGPFVSEAGLVSLGWLVEYYDSDEMEDVEDSGESLPSHETRETDYWWAAATWGRWVRKEEFENDPTALFDGGKSENTKPGFSHSEGVFTDRITGLHNGGRPEGRGVPPPDAFALFRACRHHHW